MSRSEFENKVLKDSGVDTRSSMMKLAKIDIVKSKRRENNAQMERDHTSRTIIVSDDPIVGDVTNHLLSGGSITRIEQFEKSKNYHHMPFASALDPKSY